MDKNTILNEYKLVREKLNKQPSSKEFYLHSNISRRSLTRLYGRNAFNKLVIEYGDSPKNFLRTKSDLEKILINYGLLIRNLQYIPIEDEWDNAGFRPTANGIRKSHNLKWSELPKKFIEANGGFKEWIDVIAILSPKVERNISTQIRDEKAKSCFVYLMLDKRTMLHKIGMSNTAEYREKTLQSEQPKIVLLAKKEYPNRRIAANIEKALHSTYAHKRNRGEWFLLDEGDLDELTQMLDD